MKLKNVLETNKFTLEVTMPHTIECVEAVLKGGAQALKMRCNNTGVSKLSAGVFNGPFQERKGFLKEVVDLAGGVPVGLVPGVPGCYLTEEELREVEEMGFSYFNCHYNILPTYMMESEVLEKVICTTYEDQDPEVIYGINCNPRIDVVEANVVPNEVKLKGTPLVYEDILRYTAIVKKLHQPVIATGQRIVKPSDIKHFYEAGCKAFMLGNVGFIAAGESGTPSPETCYRVTSEFREAIEKL